jgi:predicted kinase
MNTLHLLIGPAGCGKTTYREKLMNRLLGSRGVISPDEFRIVYLKTKSDVVNPRFDPKYEVDIWLVIIDAYKTLLREEYDHIIIDATNTTFKRRRKFARYALEVNYFVHYYLFETSLTRCLMNNLSRDAYVPEKTVALQWLALDREKPEIWEYDEITYVPEEVKIE